MYDVNNLWGGIDILFNCMVKTEQHRSQSNMRLTIIAIGLMILVGAIIIFMDRSKVRQVWGKAEWNYLSKPQHGSHVEGFWSGV
jgi:hypothetical protein